MRKLKKLFAVLFCVILVLSVTFVPSFAAVANGEEEFKILNSVFSAVTPKGFTLLYSEEKYSFICEKNNDTYYITFIPFKNDESTDFSSYSDEKLDSFGDYLEDILEAENYCDYSFVSAQSGVAINGVSGVKLKFKYDDYDDELYNEVMYLVAGKNQIIGISFRSFGSFPLEDEETVLSSFVLNDELFEDEAFKNTVDFTSAPDYYTALSEDVANIDEWLYGDSDGSSAIGSNISGNDIYDDLDADAAIIGIVAMVLFFVLPTVIVTALAIVFIVKYSKNKKKVKEYENKFGIL